MRNIDHHSHFVHHLYNIRPEFAQAIELCRIGGRIAYIIIFCVTKGDVSCTFFIISLDQINVGPNGVTIFYTDKDRTFTLPFQFPGIFRCEGQSGNVLVPGKHGTNCIE